MTRLHRFVARPHRGRDSLSVAARLCWAASISFSLGCGGASEPLDASLLDASDGAATDARDSSNDASDASPPPSDAADAYAPPSDAGSDAGELQDGGGDLDAGAPDAAPDAAEEDAASDAGTDSGPICGGLSERCCTLVEWPQPCRSADLACAGGLCTRCGAAGEPCCPSIVGGCSFPAVGPPYGFCDATNMCVLCGYAGEACCPADHGTSWELGCAGLGGMGQTCATSGGLSECIACGQSGQPCCTRADHNDPGCLP